jgi:uncharacterized protein (DUF427 family)
VSLTIGTGPFGHQPAGRFSFDVPQERMMYLEESPRRIRALLGGETVVDSRNPRLLHESGRLPVYYFPEGDVRVELLRPSPTRDSDELKGTARFWSLVAGDRSEEDAAWSFDRPELRGLVAFRWDAMDEWLEEDEPALKHARDPYHRIDVRQTSRHVRVSVDETLLAESERTKLLFETGLPPRFYFPADDVRHDQLEPSAHSTACAYKGYASYWSAIVGDWIEADLAWTYREPLHDALAVRDMIAFFNERVDLDVDGERWERPVTGWAAAQRAPRRS